MMRPKGWCFAVMVTLSLAGCGSSPKTHFYTLKEVPAASGANGSDVVGPVMVGQVNIPSTLDRLSMVTAGAGNQLNVSNQDRWASPLDQLLRRALTQDLRSRVRGDVLAPGDPVAPNARVLRLNVLQFMANANGEVVLDVDYSVQQHEKWLWTRHETLRTPVLGAGGEAVAAAMSDAVGKLADRIAASL
jgi:uncharacterized protein